MKINSRLRPTRGFTLLELVVVVAVLVILAGFILPKFDVFKLKANKGVAAANMTGISRLVQQYYAQNSVYPDGWDSLLTAEDELWAPGAPGTTPGLDPQLVGGPPNASPTKLAVGELTEKEARSLARIGITTLYDTTGSGAPNESFTTSRAIDTAVKVAVINASISGSEDTDDTEDPETPAALAAAAATSPDPDAQNIVSHIYPGSNGVIPAGKKLVVFGLGSRSSMLGQLMQEVPFYPNTDQVQYYSRYLAIFQVSSSGSRAELKAIVGSDGDLIKEEIADYYER